MRTELVYVFVPFSKPRSVLVHKISLCKTQAEAENLEHKLTQEWRLYLQVRRPQGCICLTNPNQTKPGRLFPEQQCWTVEVDHNPVYHEGRSTLRDWHSSPKRGMMAHIWGCVSLYAVSLAQWMEHWCMETLSKVRIFWKASMRMFIISKWQVYPK